MYKVCKLFSNLLILIILLLLPNFAFSKQKSQNLTDPTNQCYLIQSITIISNNRTKENVILQKITLNKLNEYSAKQFYEEISNSLQNLKNLGIFKESEITAHIQKTISNTNGLLHQVDLQVQVPDRWTLFPIPFFYYDNKLGFIFMFYVMEFNLFGSSHQLTSGFTLSRDIKIANAKYQAEKVFGSDYSLYLQAVYNDGKEYQYQGTNIVFESKQIWTYGDITVDRLFETGNTEFHVQANTRLDYRSNNVILNQLQKEPNDGLRWTIGVGLRQGIINRDVAMIWGDDNQFWIKYAPLDGDFELELIHRKYIPISQRSLFGYRLNLFYNGAIERQLNSKFDIRGIKLGEIRGNYGFFGNIELRPFLAEIHWPLDIHIYTPLFLDFGNAGYPDSPFRWEETTFVTGGGIHLYAPGIGGPGFGLLIDMGVNINSIMAGFSFSDYFFVKVGVQEMF